MMLHLFLCSDSRFIFGKWGEKILFSRLYLENSARRRKLKFEQIGEISIEKMFRLSMLGRVTERNYMTSEANKRQKAGLKMMHITRKLL